MVKPQNPGPGKGPNHRPNNHSPKARTPKYCCHQVQWWGRGRYMSKVGPTHCHQRSAAQRASRHAPSPTKPTRCSSRTRAAVVGPHYNLKCSPQYCTTKLYHDHRTTFKNTDNAHGEYNGAGRARSMYTIWLHAAVL